MSSICATPHKLTHKANMLGYHPQVILAGRRINDGRGKYIAEQAIKQMSAADSRIKGAKVNVLGLTFEDNCGDLHNGKLIDMTSELEIDGVEILVTDSQVEADEAMHDYGLELKPFEDPPRVDSIVAAVAHRTHQALSVEDLCRKLVKGGAVIDLKAGFGRQALARAGARAWRLRA